MPVSDFKIPILFFYHYIDFVVKLFGGVPDSFICGVCL